MSPPPRESASDRQYGGMIRAYLSEAPRGRTCRGARKDRSGRDAGRLSDGSQSGEYGPPGRTCQGARKDRSGKECRQTFRREAIWRMTWRTETIGARRSDGIVPDRRSNKRCPKHGCSVPRSVSGGDCGATDITS